MKKIILFAFAATILTLTSCQKENKKYGYLVTFNYPSTIFTPYDIVPNGVKVKMDIKELGEMNDSLINTYVQNENERRESDCKRYMEEYFKALPDFKMINPSRLSDDSKSVELLTNDAMAAGKLSALLSRIGSQATLIIISDSLLNSVNGNYDEILRDPEHKYEQMIAAYEIFDGSSIAAEIETKLEYEWIKKRRSY